MNHILHWFSLRTRIERFLIICIALLLTLSGIAIYVVTPLHQYRGEVKTQALAQNKMTSAIRQELMNIQQRDSDVARNKLQREYDRANSVLTEEEGALERLSNGLVSAGQMTDVLYRMLDLHDSLALQEVQNYPSIALPYPGSVSSESVPLSEGQVEQLYQHTVRMTLTGNYLDVLSYLDTIEKLPWKISWDEIAMTTENYPHSTVTLKFHTISDQKAWFKVS